MTLATTQATEASSSVLAGKLTMSVRNLIAAALVALLASPVLADTQPQSIDDVLRALQSERGQVSQANQEREARFRREEANQQAALTQIRRDVRNEEAEAARLENLRNELDRELEELRTQLAERQGEFGELFGVARAAAADMVAQMEESLISSQFRDRSEGLTRMARSQSLPTITELETLWFTMAQEAVEQGRVARYQASVIGTDNQLSSEEVVRVGPFVAFTPSGYLVGRDESLRYLARQPGGGAMGAARDVFRHDGDGIVRGMIDPSLGTLLGLVIETPNLRERIAQGGGIGYLIIIVATFGVLLAIYRWIMLTLTAGKVRAQMKTSTPSEDNPLGRVMKVYQDYKSSDIETLQMHLDDAVLKELPKLEAGLNVVKVLAAVAPLMGLLGTVIGMIVTFQAITLFGTGDPKLMAGGISQALVTTVQGLIAAIPLLLLHAFASGTARRLAQLLEEQSVSLVAETAERGA